LDRTGSGSGTGARFYGRIIGFDMRVLNENIPFSAFVTILFCWFDKHAKFVKSNNNKFPFDFFTLKSVHVLIRAFETSKYNIQREQHPPPYDCRKYNYLNMSLIQ